MANNFIDEFGQIHRDNVPTQGSDDVLWKEYQQLEYEIFSHNDKSPEKIARYNELKQLLKIDEQSKADAFNKAKEKLKSQIAGKTMSVSQILAMAQKENE